MSTRISIRPWVACAAVGVCTGFIYLAVSWLLVPSVIDRRLNHKTGHGANTQEWLNALSNFILGFPFGWTLLNALLWVIVGSAVGAYLLSRSRSAEK
jgi:uncharacterized membrane protein YfcA